jgi:signal transduction histidine kinase
MSVRVKNKIEEGLNNIEILMIEDNPGDARLVQEMLKDSESKQFNLQWAKNLSEGFDNISKNDFDIILLDLSLPDSHGLETFIKLHKQVNTIPIIVFTGQTDESLGIETIQKGAQDYLVKGNVDYNLLSKSITYSIERKNVALELERTQADLIETAHKAGMADIAISVLHNVGNVLNSVICSSSIIESSLKKSSIPDLLKANELLREHKNNFETFIRDNPKGSKLLEYYLIIGEKLLNEKKTIEQELGRVIEKAKVIERIVQNQQELTHNAPLIVSVDLVQAINETLSIKKSSLQKNDIKIVKDISNNIKIMGTRAKIIYIFTQIIDNAIDAIVDFNAEERIIKITAKLQNSECIISFTDTGLGIPDSLKEKVFIHGFTTKPYNNGFGLHTCANYLSEMKGTIMVPENKPKVGATFILSFKSA